MYILKRKHPLYGNSGNMYLDSEFSNLVPVNHRNLFKFKDDDECDDMVSIPDDEYELEEDI